MASAEGEDESERSERGSKTGSTKVFEDKVEAKECEDGANEEDDRVLLTVTR